MGKLTYLLDSNILSEPLKPAPNPGVMAGLQRHRHACSTAAVVWHELHYGCDRLPAGAKKQTIADYLRQLAATHLPILPYDENAAVWHAGERARLTAQGQTPSFANGQIAAIAKTNGLVVITRNTGGFSGFEGLRVENWFR